MTTEVATISAIVSELREEARQARRLGSSAPIGDAYTHIADRLEALSQSREQGAGRVTLGGVSALPNERVNIPWAEYVALKEAAAEDASLCRAVARMEECRAACGDVGEPFYADPHAWDYIKCVLKSLPAAKPEQAVIDIWAHVPAQYKAPWSFQYDERRSEFTINANGYVVASAEDSEVAHAICTARNAHPPARSGHADDGVKS